MGFLDILKKLVPKSEPMPWDPQSVRMPNFTLRAPNGWRFTEASWQRASLAGPANQTATVYYSINTERRQFTSQEAQDAQPQLLQLMRGLLKHDSRCNGEPTETVLPNGTLWTEASEDKDGQRLFAAYLVNMQAPPASGVRPHQVVLCVRTTMPLSGGALAAERFEALRGVLRSAEWN